jgi:hypothetical protein
VFCVEEMEFGSANGSFTESVLSKLSCKFFCCHLLIQKKKKNSC